MSTQQVIRRPYIVTAAIERGDWAWVWFHGSTSGERTDVDRWLVETSHPLASQAGTAEHRFRAIVAELRAES